MTDNEGEMPEGVRMLRMPIPFPQHFVNLYLIARPDGHVLVDVGPDTLDCRHFLTNGLHELGIDLSGIKMIVLTHHHVDHYGMAGWLKRQCRAPVAVSKFDSQPMEEYCRGEEDVYTRDIDFLRRFGMPDADVTAMDAASRAVQRMTTPAEPEIDLVDGMLIEGTTFRAIWTPGHSPGHMCLWDECRGVLISGDHVLTRITSNIGFHPDSGSDPLGTYLDSIRRVEMLGATMIMPGHGEIIRKVQSRIDQIYIHHESRKQAILNAIRGGKVSILEISSEIFGNDLNALNRQFAFYETLAHLELLVADGQLYRHDYGSRSMYTPVHQTAQR